MSAILDSMSVSLTPSGQASLPEVRSRHDGVLRPCKRPPHWQGKHCPQHPHPRKYPCIRCSRPCASPKYNNGIPPGSRFENHADFFKNTINSLNEEEGLKKIEKVKTLSAFAEKGACAPSTFLPLPADIRLSDQIQPSLY